MNETVQVPVNHCKRCGHRWTQRGISKPKQCPKCKRYDWDEDKVSKT